MKKITKLMLVLLLVLGAMLAVSCEKDPDETEGSNGVIVTPANPMVLAGTIQQFTAVVEGDDNPPQTVTWTVTGGTDSSISTGGLLTVGLAENSSNLTVKATSTADNTKYGTAIVRVQRISTHTGMKNIITWTLVVAETLPTRYDPKQGDLYTLTYIGGPISTGFVQNRQSNTLTLRPNNSSTTFTAIISGASLAAVNGTITWQNGNTEEGPGVLTDVEVPLDEWFVQVEEDIYEPYVNTYVTVDVTVANAFATVPAVTVKIGTTDYTFDEAGHDPVEGGTNYFWKFYYAQILTPGQTYPVTLTVDGENTVGNLKVAYPANITGPANLVATQNTTATWTLTQNNDLQILDMMYTTASGGFGRPTFDDLLPTARSYVIPANTVPSNWDYADFGLNEINFIKVEETTFAFLSYKFHIFPAPAGAPQTNPRRHETHSVKKYVMGK